MSYYTLGTVFFCAVIFFIFSIYRKDYLALFIHPYLLICLFWAFAWHNRTIYPGMAEYVDTSIAISFILLSVSFWTVYWFLPTQFINKRIFPCFQFCSEEDNLQTITQKSYWIIFVLVLIYAIHIMAVRYSLANNWNELFFSGYILRNKITSISLLRYFEIFLENFRYVIHGCVAILFIVPFIKDTKINKYHFQIISFLFAVLWSFIFFGSGFRQLMLFVPSSLIILTFIFISYRITFSKHFIPFLVLYLIISISMTLFMGIARWQGLPIIAKYITDDKSKMVNEIKKATFYTRQEENTEKVEKLYQQLANEPIIKTSNEFVVNKTNEPIVKDTNKLVINDTNNEILFLRQFFRLRKSNSDTVAVCMKFYGNHYPFYGISNAVYRWYCLFIPSKFFPNGRADKPYPLHIQFNRDFIGDVNNQSRDNYPMGLWCEGYIFSGYFGAIIFSLLGGFIFGFIGKLLFIKIKSNTVIRMDSLLIIITFYPFYLLMGTIVSGQIESRLLQLFSLIVVILLIKIYKRFSKSIAIKITQNIII
jgi:hypothetical protein